MEKQVSLKFFDVLFAFWMLCENSNEILHATEWNTPNEAKRLVWGASYMRKILVDALFYAARSNFWNENWIWIAYRLGSVPAGAFEGLFETDNRNWEN